MTSYKITIKCGALRTSKFTSFEKNLSTFAEDHGRKPMDECDGRNFRSSKSEGGCFGGFLRRKKGYHGCKPVEASCFFCELFHSVPAHSHLFQSSELMEWRRTFSKITIIREMVGDLKRTFKLSLLDKGMSVRNFSGLINSGAGMT